MEAKKRTAKNPFDPPNPPIYLALVAKDYKKA